MDAKLLATSFLNITTVRWPWVSVAISAIDAGNALAKRVTPLLIFVTFIDDVITFTPVVCKLNNPVVTGLTVVSITFLEKLISPSMLRCQHLLPMS